jgi:hypothetical protein
MSLFYLQKAMFLLKKDAGFATRLRNSPDDALDGFDLTDEERRALLSADLPTLYRMGAHPLLLAPYSRSMGITRPQYQALLAPLKGLHGLRSASDAAPAFVPTHSTHSNLPQHKELHRG